MSFGPHALRRRRPRVLLVKVPCYADVITPPINLGYLATHVRDVADVVLVDGIREQLDLRRFREIISREQPDVVGFSVVTYAARDSISYMWTVRDLLPEAAVVAGGPHPSLMPERYLDEARGALDYVVVGDGELTLRRIVTELDARRPGLFSDADLSAIPGLWWHARGESRSGAPGESPDIDDCGIPHWSLMPPATYPKAPHGAFYKRFPVAPIITTRGCPFACGFCSVPRLSGRRMRYRSLDLIAEELRLLRDRFGVQEFQIVDDNFTISRRHALAVCERLVDAQLVMPWTCPNGVRIDALDDELLDAMQAAGCYSISLGIESGNRAVLDRMVKHLSLDVVADRVEAIVRRGMEAHAFFILGYPGETPEAVEDTLRLSRSLPLTRANFSLFSPLPGTPEFDCLEPEAQADVLERAATYGQVSYVPAGVTPESLKLAQRRGILGFYLRPQQALKLARAIRSPETAYYVARRAVHWLASA